MELRVKLINAGAIDQALERVKAARKELFNAVTELDKACASVHVQVEEAANVASTDGQIIVKCILNGEKICESVINYLARESTCDTQQGERPCSECNT